MSTANMIGCIVVTLRFSNVAYDATVSLSFTLLQLIRERVTRLDTSIESISKGKVSEQAWQRCVLPIQGCARSGTLNPYLTDQTNSNAVSAMNGESKE